MQETLSIEVTPYPIVIVGKEAPRFTVEAVVVDADKVHGTVTGPEGTEPQITLDFLPDKDRKDRWRADGELPEGAPAGTWRVNVGQGEGALEVRFPVEFEGTRDVSDLTFTVQPTAAKAGDRLTFKGALEIRPRREFLIEKVTLVFRADDDPVREEVLSLRTDRSGGFLAEMPAERSGAWQMRYDGSPTQPELVEDGAQGTRAFLTAWQKVAVESAAAPRLQMVWFSASHSQGVSTLSGKVKRTSSQVAESDVDNGTVQIAPWKNGHRDMTADFEVDIKDSNNTFKTTRNRVASKWSARAWPPSHTDASDWVTDSG